VITCQRILLCDIFNLSSKLKTSPFIHTKHMIENNLRSEQLHHALKLTRSARFFLQFLQIGRKNGNSASKSKKPCVCERIAGFRAFSTTLGRDLGERE